MPTRLSFGLEAPGIHASTPFVAGRGGLHPGTQSFRRSSEAHRHSCARVTPEEAQRSRVPSTALPLRRRRPSGKVAAPGGVDGGRRDKNNPERTFSRRGSPVAVSARSSSCRRRCLALAPLCFGSHRRVPSDFPFDRLPFDVSPSCGDRGLPELLRGWVFVHDSAPAHWNSAACRLADIACARCANAPSTPPIAS